MSAANDAYDRLIAARRTVTTEEREEMKRDSDRDRLKYRIHRRLQRVY
jgi:hypothetical protein